MNGQTTIPGGQPLNMSQLKTAAGTRQTDKTTAAGTKPEPTYGGVGIKPLPAQFTGGKSLYQQAYELRKKMAGPDGPVRK
ncbi:MAG TPA: hypothetical protein VNE63_05410 [Candidatus Acidoferrales bacterium]|nr:hypothetical protein [Candidatus Acidoferrales bacterium]